MRLKSIIIVAAPLFAAFPAFAQTPVGNGFTYQGKLTDGGAPANGQYDLTFRLYTAFNAVFPIGNPVALENVQVTGGLFTARLDFGDQFDGGARWLGVSVRPGASTGAFTILSPRQEITPTPYAIACEHINLPLVDGGATDPSIVESGLLHILQSGNANGIMGQTSGSGAAVRGAANSATPNQGTGVHGTSENFRAGWFEIDNPANPHIALYATTNGAGHAIQGHTTGTGKAVGGYSNGTAGDAGYFRVGNAANAGQAVHAETIGNGAAVYARSVGGPALHIDDGYIKVQGAGTGTPTPVFVHQVTDSNRVDIGDNDIYDLTQIDHPLCNNDPNAILIVVARDNVNNGSDFWSYTFPPPVDVYYNHIVGRWQLWNTRSSDDWSLNIGDRFNVLVIKP